ncbi:MAG: hypothetical protein V3U58_06050 [Thermodesulfobacteriota bacterium]
MEKAKGIPPSLVPRLFHKEYLCQPEAGLWEKMLPNAIAKVKEHGVLTFLCYNIILPHAQNLQKGDEDYEDHDLPGRGGSQSTSASCR